MFKKEKEFNMYFLKAKRYPSFQNKKLCTHTQKQKESPYTQNSSVELKF